MVDYKHNAPVTINVKTVGFSEVEKALGAFKEKAPHVLYNVVKRVASNVNKNIAKHTKKVYSIKSADVKKTLKVKYPSKSDLTAMITSKGTTLPLIKFKVTSPKGIDPIEMKGIPKEGDKNYPGRARYKAKVLKSSKTVNITHAFVQKMKNGHIGLFRRHILSKSFKQQFRKQLKKTGADKSVKELHGPSVPQMIANTKIRDLLNKDAQATYEKRIEHEISRILKGYGAK